MAARRDVLEGLSSKTAVTNLDSSAGDSMQNSPSCMCDSISINEYSISSPHALYTRREVCVTRAKLRQRHGEN